MKVEITEPNLISVLPVLLACGKAGRGTQAARTARSIVAVASFLAAMASTASAQSPNLGDPLFCQPQEGVGFLIVNGGAGVFTADADCYNNNTNNDTALTITTSQGGTLNGTRAAENINYVYTPPTPTFTGLDTFSIPVTTVWDGAGGTGSAGGTARPGGPATLTVTLNVLPSTTTLVVPGVATLVPLPAGSISGCGAQGNSGIGPPAGAISGCTTALGLGAFRFPTTATTSHGSVSNSGNALRYTPTAGYTGPDAFTYQVFGVNTDGTTNLNSGNVTVQVTVDPPLVITLASPLPGGAPGTAYTTQTFAATGGTGPAYTFSLASGALPPGLSLSGATLSGTPTTAGVYNFTIQVTDGTSDTATKAFVLTVAVPAPTVPALGAWGMAILVGLLLLFGAKALARRPA
jgi:hypothetical protein